ncbi:MAG: GNAT family acetyltransferase [Ferruginibacter sp.]|nr:GNAT family acetyltransferase [Ferruginibacter sp.]
MLQNIQVQIASQLDIDSVLQLQELYLVTNLLDTEKKDGFVTTPFTKAQLQYVIQNQGLFIAKDKNVVIAYIFAESWLFFSQYPIFKYMITLLPSIQFLEYNFTTQNSFQYGPVCIHKNYRGMGLINVLFEFMRANISKKFPLGLTFINKINVPSLIAHTKKLKWCVVGNFQFNNNEYFILAYDMNS